MRMNILYLTVFILLFLSACGTVDPRNQADADNSRTLTAQTAADQEAARLQAQLRFDETMTVVRAAFPTVLFAAEMATVSLAISISLSLVGLGGGIGWAGLGLGKVAVRAAEMRSNLVHMDVRTRTFPLVLQYLEKGIYTCSNANTGSVVRLDTRRKEDADLVHAIAAVTHDGIVAYEVGHAKPTQNIKSLIDQFEGMVNSHAKISAND